MTWLTLRQHVRVEHGLSHAGDKTWVRGYPQKVPKRNECIAVIKCRADSTDPLYSPGWRWQMWLLTLVPADQARQYSFHNSEHREVPSVVSLVKLSASA